MYPLPIQCTHSQFNVPTPSSIPPLPVMYSPTSSSMYPLPVQCTHSQFNVPTHSTMYPLPVKFNIPTPSSMYPLPVQCTHSQFNSPTSDSLQSKPTDPLPVYITDPSYQYIPSLSPHSTFPFKLTYLPVPLLYPLFYSFTVPIRSLSHSRLICRPLPSCIVVG